MAKSVPEFKINCKYLILREIKNTKDLKAERGPSHYEKAPFYFGKILYFRK